MNALMTSKNLAGLLLLFAVAACTATADDAGGSTQGASSSSSGSSGSTTTPSGTSGAPAYAVSCDGEVTKTSSALSGTTLRPRCVGADPDGGAEFCADPCGAQEASFTYAPPAHRCGSTDVWTWDGEACVAHSTQTAEGAMKCNGADCPNIFKTEADCKAAYAQCPVK